jgi:hypothetical protein
MNQKSQDLISKVYPFQVGDTVYVGQLEGKVTAIISTSYDPVKVEFSNFKRRGFKMDGSENLNPNPVLSHTPYTCKQTKKGLLLEGFTLTKERYISGEYYWFSDWKTQWVHKEYVRTVGVEKENVANYVAINSVNNNGETTHRVYRYMQKNKP